MSIKTTASLIVLGMAASLPAQAQDLKLANYMAVTHPYVEGCLQPFADDVAQRTNGAVKVKVYNGGELGAGPAEQYNRVVDGVADFAISLPGYTASSFPLTLLAELPGVVQTDTATEALWNNIELFQSEYRRTPLVALWTNAPNILFTGDKAVRTPEDIRGMKIRVPSRNAGMQVEAWGGSPVSMPVSEIYNGLQTGVIDGAMIDGSAVDAFKLGEVANYITTGMDSTHSPFFILMNRDSYGELDEGAKSALSEAGLNASQMCNQTQLRIVAEGLESFKAMSGKELIELTPEEAAPFNELSAKVTEKVVAENGDSARQIVDALKAQ